ncbi:MAG: DUF222 domain-containing protein [Nocardioidaceae bacterium]|nr:DUF222 domain-containing protein [Nocardioidaceae bacterium]
MTVSALPLGEHPAFAVLAAVEGALAGGGDLSVYDGLSAEDAVTLAGRWSRVNSKVAAHAMAATRSVDRSGAARRAGASSTGSLLASQFGGDRNAAARDVHLGWALEKATLTEHALADGRISKEQARLIARAIAGLPDDIPAETRQKCERALIEDAKTLTMRDLQYRADRISDMLKPVEEVDADEGQKVEDRERQAYERSQLWLRDNRDGTWAGSFTLPEAQAGALKSALDGFSAPRRRHLDDGQADTDLTYPQRQGRAFIALIDHLPTDGLPDAGGSGMTVTLNLDLQQLIDGLGTATTSTGQRMSASQVRQHACRVGIVPQVLGGQSLPLDLGRKQRLFTPPNASPWRTGTRGARCPTATGRRPGARRTTRGNPGPTAGAPIWRTGCCSVPSTTG